MNCENHPSAQKEYLSLPQVCVVGCLFEGAIQFQIIRRVHVVGYQLFENEKARPSEKLVINTAAETIARFKQEKANLPLDDKIVDKIDAQAASIPIYSQL
jgi:hypothetical protein